MYKPLIENSNFDLVKFFNAVSEEAKKEKLGAARPPISEITYWWTRKPLIVGRGVALASTLTNLDIAYKLLGLSKKNRAFNNKVDVDLYAQHLDKKPSEIKVLDPFAGAGTLIYASQELGLNCTAMDYNPVAYIIMKSVLEYPIQYSTKLGDEIADFGKRLIEKSMNDIGNFFSRNGRKSLHYLWVWNVKCPYCKQRVPLTQHMWLARKKKIGMRFLITDDLNYIVELVRGIDDSEGNIFTQRKRKAICIRCRNSIGTDHIVADIANNKDKEMIAVVVKGSAGKDYELPSVEDRENLVNSSTYLKRLWNEFYVEGLIPDEDIRPSLTNSLLNYGIKKWNQFFGDRQLLVMITLLKNIKIISKAISDPTYAKVIATYLSLLICKHIDRNSIGTRWDVSNEQIGSTLAFRRPSLVYNHAEVNPFEKTSGSLSGMLNDIVDAIRFASNVKQPCKIHLNSVLNLSKVVKQFDLIITDPPYADDVQYGELSEFFYVWIYRALKDYYPELPSVVNIEEDISVSLFRFGNKQLAKSFYEKAMKEALKQIYNSLNDDGLLVLFFAHSTTEAWNLLLHVLRGAKFKVVSSYAVHTESTGNIVAVGRTSFMSSIVIACRKIIGESNAYFEDLLPKIEDKVKYMIRNLTLEELLELPMTDLLIMTYGKVLEEATQYTILKSYNVDFKPEFENLIKDAREFILKEIVTKMTGRSPNTLGSDTSFYIVTKVFYRGILDSNDALKIAWAYQINIEDLQEKQIAKREAGITKLLFFDEVELKKPEEIDRNDLHHQLIYLGSIASREGVSGVKRVSSHYTNFRIHDLKQIANLLIKNYRTMMNKKEMLTVKEQKELEILQTLADTLNLSISVGSRSNLEKFMD